MSDIGLLVFGVLLIIGGCIWLYLWIRESYEKHSGETTKQKDKITKV